MKHTFYKYQGTGNDFIIFDNRQHELDFLTKIKLKAYATEGLVLVQMA